jgi:hypothetical protein
MTCTVLTTSSTQIALVALLRNGPRPRPMIIQALIACGAATTPNSVDRVLSHAASRGIVRRVRLGWYGPAPVEIAQTCSERVYALLETRPGLTAMEIAQAVGLGTRSKRTRVYMVLGELEALGWARRTDEKPARWYVEEA